MKLSINIDHVATLREARKGKEPDVLAAALEVIRAGADGITFHLREDRRHIQDSDVFLFKEKLNVPLNFEGALCEEIIKIVLKVLPYQMTIVPEKREELTTEGGLDVIKNKEKLVKYIPLLKEKNIRVSLFVEPDKKAIEVAKEVGADTIEIHTGHYANLEGTEREKELTKIKEMARFAKGLGLTVNAGHGLNYENTHAIAKIKEIEELSIGHSIISRAVFVGIFTAVKEMLSIVKE